MLTPVTDAFLVNTTTQGSQDRPIVADLPGGGFVIVWSVDLAGRANPNASEVYGQIYDASGAKLGGEFIVATGTANQFATGVTATADGFIVTWDEGEILAQRYGPTGAPIGAAYTVNSTLVGGQSNGIVDTLAGGGVVAVYESQSETSGSVNIRYRVLGADGAAGAAADALVNDAGQLTSGVADVAALDGGGFAVIFSGGIRRYSSAGDLLGTSAVSADAERRTPVVRIAALDGGGFVAAYFSTSPNELTSQFRYRVFDAAGAPTTGEITLLSGITSISWDVIGTAGGGFVIAYGTGTERDINLQAFNAAGSAVGSAVLANTATTGMQLEPSLDRLSDGRIVVSWTDEQPGADDTTGDAVRARIFAVSGGPTPGDDQLKGTANGETIDGLGGADLIEGFEGDDVLSGSGGNDWLVGGVGSDQLDPGDGVNVLDGGDGLDFASFASRSAGVWADLAAGAFSDATTWATYLSIEGLIGSSAADALFGDGNANTLRGGAGGDALDGRAGTDVLEGGDGDDYLVGGDGTDILRGGAGVDTLTGGAGADLFDLGAAAGWDVATDFDAGQGDRIQLGAGQAFQFLVERDANGDGVADTQLSWSGGTFVALGVSGLDLAEWNALVV